MMMIGVEGGNSTTSGEGQARGEWTTETWFYGEATSDWVLISPLSGITFIRL